MELRRCTIDDGGVALSDGAQALHCGRWSSGTALWAIAGAKTITEDAKEDASNSNPHYPKPSCLLVIVGPYCCLPRDMVSDMTRMTLIPV